MHRQPMRLIDLFAHWRDQHLYDLEAVIIELADKQQLSAHALSEQKIVTTLFQVDEHGRPTATRREVSLRDLLYRYTGIKRAEAAPIAPLLRTLRLERERRLRTSLHTTQVSLARLLDVTEVEKLHALLMDSSGLRASVANLLKVASAAQSDAMVNNYPATLLAGALASSDAQGLLREMYAALAWQPELPDSAALSVADLALLTLTLQGVLDPEGNFHGFDFYAEPLVGVSIETLRTKMRQYLRPRLSGCPDEAFGLIHYLLRGNMPAELTVLGLPDELAWVTGITWVMLSHGVTLAELIAPGVAPELSLNDALELPATLGEQRADEGMTQAIAAALIPAVHRWNKATQYIAGVPSLLTPSRVLQAYLEQTDAIEAATIDLQRTMPTRLGMALAELKARNIAPYMRFVEAADRVRQSLTYSTGIRALEAVMNGTAAGENPTRVPALVRGHNGRLHEPWCNAFDIPDIGARFEDAFNRWKKGIVMASRVIIVRLLGDLQLADRLRLENHPVTVCRLARHVPGTEKFEFAHYGFVVHVATPAGGWCYGLVPSAGWCRVDHDPEWRITRPVAGDHERVAQQLPYDWQAFASGQLPDPQSSFQGWLEPVARIPPVLNQGNPVFRNARLIAGQCGRQTALTLATFYPQARGTLARETPAQIPDEIKALVPLWSSIETIKQGFDEKRGWLVVLGLIGLVGDAITLGAVGRLCTLGIRFVIRALRYGTKSAARSLGPRLRGAARDALDALIPVGADPEAKDAPVADLGLILSIRRNHADLLRNAAKRLGVLTDAQRVATAPALAPLKRPTLYVRRFEDDTQMLVGATGSRSGVLLQPRLVESLTALPYGPVLDVIDDTGRLGRLPKTLPVTAIGDARYLPDPAPSLPKQWIRWGDETWLECSGRFYRLDDATAARPAMLVQAPSPFSRPSLARSACRSRRGLPPLICRPTGARNTANYRDLSADSTIPPGAVEWFDQRSIIPAENARFVDGKRLIETRQGKDHVVEHLSWDNYRSEISGRRVAGNDIFQRIELDGGLVDNVNDRRFLSAVQVQDIDGAQIHLVTCADDGIYYHGLVNADETTFTLRKLAEGDSPTGELMTPGEELKFLFNGCWDANLHIRQRGMTVVTDHLRQIEAALEKGLSVNQLMSRRFRLSTTPAQAALFAKYPRRSFASQTRQFVASDYTYPLTAQTPVAVRAEIAKHLNRLIETPGLFDATRVLDPTAIANAPPKGKNIAFLTLTYRDGRPADVYFSVSGAFRRKTEMALGKRLADEGKDATAPWVSADGTRYFNCRGGGNEAGSDALLHLPDLSQPGNLNSGNINDRRLDSERNILARLQQTEVDLEPVSGAMLFTRYPTCQSCTTLIAEYRQHFPAERFRVFEGPLPGSTGSGPSTSSQAHP